MIEIVETNMYNIERSIINKQKYVIENYSLSLNKISM